MFNFVNIVCQSWGEIHFVIGPPYLFTPVSLQYLFPRVNRIFLQSKRWCMSD